jgi:hypothetical protein
MARAPAAVLGAQRVDSACLTVIPTLWSAIDSARFVQ